MTQLVINWNTDFEGQIEEVKLACIRASIRAFDRMGLFVEARAVQIVKVNTGRLRGSIHKTDATYDRTTGSLSVEVHSDAGYSLYVEMGFQGHFVPFDVAPDLYYQAIRQWGWRVPTSADIKNPQPGRRYLIPRGRKSPVWGVKVKGTARPFLRPALEELERNGVRENILQEEFAKEFARI